MFEEEFEEDKFITQKGREDFIKKVKESLKRHRYINKDYSELKNLYK